MKLRAKCQSWWDRFTAPRDTTGNDESAFQDAGQGVPGARGKPAGREKGSTLVIVLWIAFGLVSITLYFAQSMNYELRASENRVAGLAADDAIEGGARYVSYLLQNMPTNGIVPDPSTYECQAVPVGDAHFWMIGRDTNYSTGPTEMAFGLVDEASKLNLNTMTSNMLVTLPNMTADLTQAILDWRDTNGGGSQTYYAMMHPSYQNKSAPFETVDELRLVYGADMDTIIGEDANRNGVLDPDENDANHNNMLDPGLLEYFTVYSREPMTNADGTTRVNIHMLTATTSAPLRTLLENSLNSSRATQIMTALGLEENTRSGSSSSSSSSSGGGRSAAPAPPVMFQSPLQFFMRSGMTSQEFATIANKITVTNGTYIEGRVNINTASPTVLAALPGISDSPNLAQSLVTYRQNNPDKLGSIGWIVDALGSSSTSTLAELAAADCITTVSYQFSADIAAIGPHGRGYRRTLFIFDTADGTPKIIYRQDRTNLGWALGKDVRQAWMSGKPAS